MSILGRFSPNLGSKLNEVVPKAPQIAKHRDHRVRCRTKVDEPLLDRATKRDEVVHKLWKAVMPRRGVHLLHEIVLR